LPPPLTAHEEAARHLLAWLDVGDYDFVTVTPESHRRVVGRPDMARATGLRDIFGWSLPFDDATAGEELLTLLRNGELLRESGDRYKSTVRVSRVRGQLFLHSAFPTDSDDSVFLGPDTLRFLDFIERELTAQPAPVARLVDIGAGAGLGGILAAKMLPAPARVELADINTRALSFARINAAHAGIEVETIESDGVAAIASGFDLAIANPPFIVDEGGPAYRSGGGLHGAELSLRWALDGAAKLAPGGRVLLYTGSAIVDGKDALRDALERELPALGCTMRWRELDPDIFGEELAKPAYREVERIAAIGAVLQKR
jgi:methylase of polypeptide subunit release factors